MIAYTSLPLAPLVARCVLPTVALALVLGCADHENGGYAPSRGDPAVPSAASMSTGSSVSIESGTWGGVQPGGATQSSGGAGEIRQVLLISVDGLAARFLHQLMSADRLPAFTRLARLGASTENARTDATHTTTLPNHTSMLTGLPVLAPPGAPAEQGHGYTANTEPGAGVTLHNSGNPARTYTPSVFDVAHDHGLATAMFASKQKFAIFVNSYNDAGATDEIAADDGTQKIDIVEINDDLTALTDALIAVLADDPPNFSFVHFAPPDAAGHALGWGSAEYLDAIANVDGALARILTLLEGEPSLASRTAVILTADHGGTGSGHVDAANPDNFVIPFLVLGPGIPGGRDLYSLVGERRTPPASDTNPGFDVPGQPIRNGDSANLALALLGLAPLRGSLMDSFGLAPAAHTVLLPARTHQHWRPRLR